MSVLHRRTRAPSRIRSAGAEHGRDLMLALVPFTVTLTPTWHALDLTTSYPAQAVALYLILCGVILRYAPAGRPPRGLGAPNRITLLRASLILPVAALVFHADAFPATGYWWILAICAVALVLDAVDGTVARRTNGSTPFGARFDMELDAFMILVLSLLVWLSGQAGPWVLLIGAFRYLFGATRRFLPALRKELPPSGRRRAVCGVQGVVLLLCLAPITPSALASWWAAGALGVLAWSFAIDVRWLLRSSLAPEEKMKRARDPGLPGQPTIRTPRDPRTAPLEP